MTKQEQLAIDNLNKAMTSLEQARALMKEAKINTFLLQSVDQIIMDSQEELNTPSLAIV
jgi:CMP-2-keto-3-deoxyoctulosonic acid synthetase